MLKNFWIEYWIEWFFSIIQRSIEFSISIAQGYSNPFLFLHLFPIYCTDPKQMQQFYHKSFSLINVLFPFFMEWTWEDSVHPCKCRRCSCLCSHKDQHIHPRFPHQLPRNGEKTELCVFYKWKGWKRATHHIQDVFTCGFALPGNAAHAFWRSCNRGHWQGIFTF